MGVARNVVRDPRLVPGGGAVEMALSRQLAERSSAVQVRPGPDLGITAQTAAAFRSTRCQCSVQLVGAVFGIHLKVMVKREQTNQPSADALKEGAGLKPVGWSLMVQLCTTSISKNHKHLVVAVPLHGSSYGHTPPSRLHVQFYSKEFF